MYFGRAAMFTLKEIHSVAVIQMLPPRYGQIDTPTPSLCLLTSQGEASVCSVVSWPLCRDVGRALIVLPGVG